MGELIMSAPVAGLTSKNKITAEDVTMLRREVFADGVMGRGEAEALFALDQTARDKCGEWAPFFVEAVTDYIVHQEKPEGYISEQNADWLVRTISRDGMVDSRTELELLVHVLEEAKSSPGQLSAYALEQVAHAVIDGKGPLMLGDLVPGLITKAEVDLLRRILYAYGGDGNIAISKAEAEVLFRINDRTAAAENDPSWNDLFVKAIANYVMCSTGYEPPTREVALRHETFLDEAGPTLGGFFSRMVSGGFAAILEAYHSPGDIEAEWEARNRATEALARRAETIDASEAEWLAERVGGGQRPLRDNERALLTLIKHASPEIHPALRPLLDKVA
ncbi:hypothetical protein FJ414_29200 [Mesorhizobium sp. B3-1-6]|uniref:hypothetical protein n=1 Tax=Mesorhizobium sp. B3-1-6 TaxID=2589895 RepID=UPI001129AAD0|nr:hypothetical protein [Mesorhizobium sp. B3-1-6]TPI27073.1 hypothetical protein FJ414_29200 [Mesorhizobium sp. B3-1-6]